MQHKPHNRIFTYVAGAATVAIAAAMIAVGAPAATAATNVTVTGVISGFTPKTFHVTAGQATTITFKNGDAGIPHDLTVADLSFKVAAAGGATASKVLTATAAQVGSHKFICSIPGHAQAGMVGTLIVDPAGAAAPAPAAGSTPAAGSASGSTSSGSQVGGSTPAGGVSSGGGSTAGLTHVNLLMLGGGLLIAAMMSALLGMRVTRRD